MSNYIEHGNGRDTVTAPINWTELEAKAVTLNYGELRRQIRGLLDALPAADARDRALETDDGGRYRDEISVLRREIKTRETVRDATRPEFLSQIHNYEELLTLSTALAVYCETTTIDGARAEARTMYDRYEEARRQLAHREGR